MTRHRDSTGRRAFLAGAGAFATAGLAGCTGLIGGEDDPNEASVFGQIGSGRAGRPEPGGTKIEDLPDLEGELTVYSGRGEFLVGRLLGDLEEYYEGFSIEPEPRYGNSAELVNQIAEEGEATPADVFYTVDAAALGALADEGRTRSLSSDLLETVREEFRTDQWIGTSGRARTVPYNTEALSADDLPDGIDGYATDFDGDLGWAPSYGSCQGFVTAMRLLTDEQTTREWLEGVVDAGIDDYPNEMAVCQAIADGEIDAGFTNHYYIQRVLDGSPDAPLSPSFTSGDAGAVFDVAGAAVTDAADDPELAENFVRHLLSAQAQEYFATETYEYPLIPEVEPVGGLPTIDELDVPDLDLSRLSDLDQTVSLMREVGIDV